jgi:hypothetical protein
VFLLGIVLWAAFEIGGSEMWAAAMRPGLEDELPLEGHASALSGVIA